MKRVVCGTRDNYSLVNQTNVNSFKFNNRNFQSSLVKNKINKNPYHMAFGFSFWLQIQLRKSFSYFFLLFVPILVSSLFKCSFISFNSIQLHSSNFPNILFTFYHWILFIVKLFLVCVIVVSVKWILLNRTQNKTRNRTNKTTTEHNRNKTKKKKKKTSIGILPISVSLEIMNLSF